MAVELEQKSCTHPACKCGAKDGDFCSEFCAKVETSEDDRKCGCGHTACDAFPELGNEVTFAPTAS